MSNIFHHIKKKRKITLKMLFGFFLFPCFLFSSVDVDVISEGAILINGHSGFVLFEKNAHQQFYPASTTKIATLFYALKKGKNRNHLGKMAKATQEAIGAISSKAKKKSGYKTPPHWLEFGGTHIGIKKGEQLSLQTLLYGLILASGNDAANVIAEHLSGSVPEFMAELNRELKKIGCQQTLFLNPHGLHHPSHRTTPYDLALLTREAMKDPLCQKICSTVRYERPETNMQKATFFITGNELLHRNSSHYYPYAIGGKTGFTKKAQHTLVAVAEKGERFLIAVLFRSKKSKDKYEDAKKLFEAAFAEKRKQYTLVRASQVFSLAIPHANHLLKASLHKDITASYYPSEKPEMRAQLIWDEQPALPIHRGGQVGKVAIFEEGIQWAEEIPIYALEDVSYSFLYSFQFWMKENRHYLIYLLLGTIIMMLSLLCIKIMRKRE